MARWTAWTHDASDSKYQSLGKATAPPPGKSGDQLEYPETKKPAVTTLDDLGYRVRVHNAIPIRKIIGSITFCRNWNIRKRISHRAE